MSLNLESVPTIADGIFAAVITAMQSAEYSLTDINKLAKENALTIQREFSDLSIETIKKLARFVTFAQLGIAEAENCLKVEFGPDYGLSQAGVEMIFEEAVKEALNV